MPGDIHIPEYVCECAFEVKGLDVMPSGVSPSRLSGRCRVIIRSSCLSTSSSGRERVQQRRRARFSWLSAREVLSLLLPSLAFWVAVGVLIVRSVGVAECPRLVGWCRQPVPGSLWCCGCWRGAVIRAGNAAAADAIDSPVRGLRGSSGIGHKLMEAGCRREKRRWD